jgi:hypothetical protein
MQSLRYHSGAPSIVLSSVLKHSIGKDLTRIIFPVNFIKPPYENAAADGEFVFASRIALDLVPE